MSNISFTDPDEKYFLELEVGYIADSGSAKADIVAYIKSRLAQVPGVTYPVKGWETVVTTTTTEV